MYEDWVRQAINNLCFTCEYKYVLVIWISLGRELNIFFYQKKYKYAKILDIFFFKKNSTDKSKSEFKYLIKYIKNYMC
jgi:hypothetical protein